MPELSDSSPHKLMSLRCPMCGAERTTDAPDCAECGEVFKPEREPDPANARKLREQIRALTAMHILLGVFLIALIKLYFFDSFYQPRTMFGGNESFLLGGGSGVLALGHIAVGVGVYFRNLVALRLSMFFSVVTMIVSLWTICLFLLSLLLIAGINQASRIIRMIREERKLEFPVETAS